MLFREVIGLHENTHRSRCNMGRPLKITQYSWEKTFFLDAILTRIMSSFFMKFQVMSIIVKLMTVAANYNYECKQIKSRIKATADFFNSWSKEVIVYE